MIFEQSAKVMDASCDLGCDLKPIHQPRPPYQTGALASDGGAIYEGVAYYNFWCHVTIFNIRRQWKDPKIYIFYYKSIL